METIESWESFKTIDGRFQFHYMEGIVRQEDGHHIIGRWKTRTKTCDDTSALYNVRPLQTKGRGPVMQPGWTRGSSEIDLTSSSVYVKTPTMLDFTDSGLQQRITRDIVACEEISLHPQHPNIAKYDGCIVHETTNRVEGLVFQRYRISLLELCNPRRLNKQAFVTLGDDRTASTGILPCHLSGIMSALQHLHEIGLVHNDVNPSNIMVDGKGDKGDNIRLVLVDFDSCRPEGASLTSTQARRTHGWHDRDVTVSHATNDLDALDEIRAWLFGDVEALRWK